MSNYSPGSPNYRRLMEFIDREYLPFKVGVQGDYYHINSTHHPFEKEFLEKLDELNFKIVSITHLKEIGQTITCREVMR